MFEFAIDFVAALALIRQWRKPVKAVHYDDANLLGLRGKGGDAVD